jgi:hypothetical protein
MSERINSLLSHQIKASQDRCTQYEALRKQGAAQADNYRRLLAEEFKHLAELQQLDAYAREALTEPTSETDTDVASAAQAYADEAAHEADLAVGGQS